MDSMDLREKARSANAISKALEKLNPCTDAKSGEEVDCEPAITFAVGFSADVTKNLEFHRYI